VDAVYPFNFSGGSAATEVVPLWEMMSKKAEVSLFSIFNPLAAAVAQSNINLIKSNLLNLQSGQYLTGPSPGSVTTPASGSTPASTVAIVWPDTDTSAAAWELLSFYLVDVTSYMKFVPELHYTRTVNAQYFSPASFSNVGRVYSSATLISAWAVPNGLLFGFPSAPAIPLALAGFNLGYGWFTNGPEVRQISHFKWQIIQTWEWGLWSGDMYGTIL
jgi:hypothetical protein